MERDVDSAQRAFRLKAAAWALPAGLIGVFAGGFAASLGGWPVAAGAVIGGLTFPIVVALVALGMADRVANAATSLLWGSGRSTPARPEYSLVDALAALGRYDEALAELERCAAERADDPEPLIRGARLLRDTAKRYDEAAQWFRRALAAGGMSPALEVQLLRELVELHRDRLHAPRGVLSDLARFAHQHRGMPEANWARAQVAEIKRLLWQ
jgi:tetratricopeptide (TPR) repeat protein